MSAFRTKLTMMRAFLKWEHATVMNRPLTNFAAYRAGWIAGKRALRAEKRRAHSADEGL